MSPFDHRFRTRHLPTEDGTCGWLATAAPLVAKGGPVRHPTGHVEADAVVVGAGFTGLAAARRLAELMPDGRILLLDAGRLGSGASGRSSGFVVDMAYFTAVMAGPQADASIRLARAGIEELDRRVEDASIDCDWNDTGWLHVAAGEAGMGDLGVLRRWLDGRGEPHQVLERDDLAAELGTDFYRQGVRLPGRPLVHPGKLVRGLGRSLPAAVELYEETPVLEQRRSRRGGDHQPWRLATPAAEITTPRVLVTANGYSAALGLLGDRVFPLLTYGSFTRPLTDDEAAELGGERSWGVLAQDPLGSSLRRLPDGRLLVRNTLAYSKRLTSPSARERARDAHRRSLAARFPALFPTPESVPLEYTWGGVMGATPVRASYLGEVAPDLWAVAGFTGAGIAQGTALGRVLAEKALGLNESDLARDAAALPQPPRLPPDPFRSLGIRWRVGRMNRAAGEAP